MLMCFNKCVHCNKHIGASSAHDMLHMCYRNHILQPTVCNNAPKQPVPSDVHLATYRAMVWKLGMSEFTKEHINLVQPTSLSAQSICIGTMQRLRCSETQIIGGAMNKVTCSRFKWVRESEQAYMLNHHHVIEGQ